MGMIVMFYEHELFAILNKLLENKFIPSTQQKDPLNNSKLLKILMVSFEENLI